MNFKYVLLSHSNEMTQLILFLRLFGKQNQNILVVNYYKMKTALSESELTASDLEL